MKQRRYILENLDCANCAAKMERKISQMNNVSDVSITYATKQLRLESDIEEDALLPQLQTICSSIESAVKVLKPTVRKRNRAPLQDTNVTPGAQMNHSSEDECGCGEDHLHENNSSHHDDCGCGADHSPHLDHVDAVGSIKTHVKDSIHHQDPHGEHDHGAEAFENLSERKPATKSFWKDQQELIQILIGVALFVFGLLIKNTSTTASLISYIIAYIILGGEVVLSALKNITKGQIFDENFLMSIATIGAFIIGDYPEAVGVMLFFRVGELFEHKAVEKSRNQIMEAVDLRPEVVQLVVNQNVTTIPAEDAEIGDILLIRPGDRIPLDGVIIEGDTRIDTSPITGEPVPIKAGEGDSVTSGCVNSSGVIKIKVEKVLEDSMVSRILDSVENAAASKPKIDRFITTFSRYYTPIVVAIAVIVAIVPSLVTGDWNHWVYTALTFLVISCPCALVLSVPLAYFSGIGSGSKKGILFKGGVSLEAMKNVKAVIMDKTGTITKGDFTVQEIIPAKDKSIDEIMTLCASSELSSTHPIGASIVTYAKSKGLTLTTPSSIEEIAGHGIKANIDGQEVLAGNRKLMDQFHINMEQKKHQQYGTEVYVAANGEYLGSVLIADTLKEEAVNAIHKIKAQGIHTVMLTGDSNESAQAIAEITGIDEVHAKLLPEDKLNELKKVRDKKGAIMFVGDGINDAPVLAGADVGAAMGSGADAAIEAADVVFMTSSVDAIPQALSIAKVTARISVQNIVLAMVIKVAIMILGLLGFANMWLAVFADTGVAILCILNSIRVLYKKY